MEIRTNIDRKDLFSSVKRIVVKAGSGILAGRKGLNYQVINNITKSVSAIKKEGYEAILVSSGAIASGLRKVGQLKIPDSVAKKQAIAAAGQSSLMNAYDKAFSRNGDMSAQILITGDDLTNRRRYLNARNTIFTLLSWDIIPVINENDTVVIDEIKFGDNDNLSAMVANMTDSQLLIILTDIDGLFDDDPRINKNAKLIPFIERINNNIFNYASSTPGALGTGGMASKVTAAKKAVLKGIPVVIANGRKKNIINKIIKGENTGTLFTPRETSICGRKHWIAFSRSIKGEIEIDEGATRALIENGKSLLPSGVTNIFGKFSRGDSVRIVDVNKKEIAIGMADYNFNDLLKIKGLKSGQIEEVLGYKHNDEVIHRDNLVITHGIDIGEKSCR